MVSLRAEKKPVSEDHSQEVLFWKIPTERYRQEKKGMAVMKQDRFRCRGVGGVRSRSRRCGR